MKVTYICRSPPKKNSHLFYFIFIVDIFVAFFGAFRDKGSSKTRKTTPFKKFHLGSSQNLQKMWGGFLPFFWLLLSVVLLDFLYRVLGRFVTREVQKRNKKIAVNFPQPPPNTKALTHLHLRLTSLFFGRPPPCRKAKKVKPGN
jgi:hypothetical protein